MLLNNWWEIDSSGRFRAPDSPVGIFPAGVLSRAIMGRGVTAPDGATVYGEIVGRPGEPVLAIRRLGGADGAVTIARLTGEAVRQMRESNRRCAAVAAR